MIELSEKKWTNEEIERGLRQIPALLARKAEEIAEKDAVVKQMKLAISLIEAAESVKKRNDKYSATELKAFGLLATEDQRKELIFIEKEYALLKVEFDELSNDFDAVRKAANIMTEEMRQLNYSNRR